MNLVNKLKLFRAIFSTMGMVYYNYAFENTVGTVA